MPLRDHFQPPVSPFTSWEAFHAQWPAMIVLSLQKRLPRRYIANPRVHSGARIELDIATNRYDDPTVNIGDSADGHGNIAALAWAPPQPTLFRNDGLARTGWL